MTTLNRFVWAPVMLGLCLSSTSLGQAQSALDDPLLGNEALVRKKAFQRAYRELKQRAFPLRDVPVDVRLTAFQQVEAALQSAATNLPTATAQGSVWVNIGPAPIRAGQVAPAAPVSGRISELAVDPANVNRWLAGAAQGGVWETTDAGVTWTPLTDREASLAIGAIAFAPSNPSIIYVGTGESSQSGDAYAGAGLLKSTDAGATWQLLAASTFAKNAFSEIKVHPTNPNLVLASVTGGIGGRGARGGVPGAPSRGVYRSADGGVNWSLRLIGQASDLEVDPGNFNNQFAAIGAVGGTGSGTNGVYRSVDAGQNWIQIDGPWSGVSGGVGRIEMAIAPSAPNTLYVSVHDANNGTLNDGRLLGIWRTDNAQAAIPTWRQLPSPTGVGDQLWYDHDVLVDRANANILYFGEVGLWKYDGNNWTAIAGNYDPQVRGRFIHPDQHALAWAGTRLVVGNDGGVFSTPDGGTTWTNHNAMLSTIQVYDGAIHPTNGNLVLVGVQDNGTSKWTGSNVWDWVEGGDGADCAISAARPDTDWAVSSQNLAIMRTRNGGATVLPADMGIEPFGRPFIARFEMCPNNSDVFIAGTDNIWRCNDFFTANQPNWTSNGPDMRGEISALAFAASAGNCGTYAFGTEVGELRLTTDGGSSWTDIDTANRVPSRYITDVAFHPTNANLMCVTVSGFDQGTPGQPGHVFLTTNALSGAPVWANISPSVNIPVNTVVFDPNDSAVMYIGTDMAVWRSIDGGASWTIMGPGTGMPLVAVFELQINRTGDRLYAFTHGRGTFALQPGSTNVADVGVTLTDSPDPVSSGQELVYTATVVNNGPRPATSVTLIDNLPAEVTFVSVAPGQGACGVAGRRITCGLGTLGASAQTTVRIRVRAGGSGSIANAVSVRSAEADPVSANNIASTSTTVNNPITDLAIGGTVVASPVFVGRTLTYQLGVTNLGPTVAGGVTVNDTLPAGVTFVSATASQGACAPTATGVSCGLGTLAAGDSARVTITVRPSVAGSVTNTASVGAAVTDLVPSNNVTRIVGVALPPAPLVVAAHALLEEESVAPANGGIDPGEKVTIRFFLRNVGVLNTTDLVATLIESGNVTAASAPQSYGALVAEGPAVGRPFVFTATGGNGDRVVATLQLRDGVTTLGTVTFTFGLSSSATFSNLGVITINPAGAATPYPASILVSGVPGVVGRAVVTLTGLIHSYPADLDVLLVAPNGQNVLLMSDAGGTTPVNGRTVVFDDNAAGFVPEDRLPSGAYKPTDLELGDALAAPAPSGPHGETLGALSGAPANGLWHLYVFDDTPGDAGRIAGGWSLAISTVDPVDPDADLLVRTSAAPDPVTAGSNVTYTVTVTNRGPDEANGVRLTNQLPAGVNFVSVSASQGSCTNLGGVVVCDLGALSVGADASVAIVGDVQTSGALTLVASAGSSTRDFTPANNTARATAQANAAMDLAVTVTDSPDPVIIRNTVTYSLVVTNRGPSSASGVRLTNALPAGVTFVSVGTSQGSCVEEGGVVRCDLGDLSRNASVGVTIQAASPAAAGPLTNIASVSAQAPMELALANNRAVAVTTNLNSSFIIVEAGARLVAESFSPANGGIDSGERVTVRLALRNVGTSSTTNLIATLATSSGVLSPSVAQDYGALAPNGPAVVREFSFNAAGENGSPLVVGLQVQEGSIVLGTVNFNFTLGGVAIFTSAGGLTFTDAGLAVPYPSAINVSGLSGLISRVTVTLSGLTHAYPDDLDIALVPPSGSGVVLMSDAGGGVSVNDVALTFDDAATEAIPESDVLTPGTYRPADYESGEIYPAPAPSTIRSVGLSSLVATEPNGVWRLFAVDDTRGDVGRLAGWSLSIATVTSVGPTPALLRQPRLLGDGRFQFTVAGQQGETYVIQSSADLVNWSPISTNAMVANTLTFQQSPTDARRFFRVVRP